MRQSLAGNERCNCQFDTGLVHYSHTYTQKYGLTNLAFSIAQGRDPDKNLILLQVTQRKVYKSSGNGFGKSQFIVSRLYLCVPFGIIHLNTKS